MSETHNVGDDVGLTQSDALADVISSGHFVLERFPPDYVKKISQYLECSAGPSSQNRKAEAPPEVNSDSGDSLFITQLPVPQAVRTVRRRKYSQHTLATELDDSGADSSSSHSDDADHETSRKKRKKRKIKLPKCSFSFLTERKWKHSSTQLTIKQNKKFHNYVMGGFFKCVELRQRAEDLHDGLPTIDQDDGDIAPLTEEEGEDKSGDEDIKVVGKTLFLAKSKAKWQQPWCAPLQCTKQHQEEEEVTQEREKIDKISNEMSTSSMPLAKDKKQETHSSSTCNDLPLLGNNEPQRNNVVQIQTPRSKRTPFPQETPELVDVETTTECVPFKPEVSDWQSVREEGEDSASSVTEGDVASVKNKENNRQEQERVNLGLDLKEHVTCSLSQDEFTEKNKQREVEENSCVVSQPLNDERQGKKKKKKRSHKEPASLDTTAASQETAKRKQKMFPGDDFSPKSSSDALPLHGSEEKMPSCLSPDESRCTADGTEKMSGDVQLVSKKKKKKKSCKTIPEMDEFVSGLRNKNIRTSSFLVADEEERSALEAELHCRFKKKKKKSGDHGSAEDFVAVSSHCALPENMNVEGKKRRNDSQVERQESTAGSAFSKPDETKAKKKKKKKHKDQLLCETEETLPFDTEESGALSSSLNQASNDAESSPGGATCNKDALNMTEETPDMPEDDTINDLKDRKKKKKRKKSAHKSG